MSEELSFVLITPYSLMKSRTGGIIARLLSRTDLELVGTQVLTPTAELLERYMESMREQLRKRDEVAAKLYCDYMVDNLSPLPDGTLERVLMLLFKGENACEKLASVIGELPYAKNRRSPGCGETIRDTYADLVFNRDGSLSYFEPAVFTPAERCACEERLEFLADFLERSPNIVTNAVGQDENSERTLVLIKPDNWRYPSTKPGNIIDMFSKTGLRIVGTKIFQMSVKEALEFYGPVKNNLRKELAPAVGHKLFAKLAAEMDLTLRPESERLLTESVGLDFADDQFSRLVEFMSGTRPEKCPEKDLEKPGKVKSMILIYEGENAIRKIREVLGPADPDKAPVGTIRHEFGRDIMTNTAHASDSQANYLKESAIVKAEQNSMASVIREYLAARS